MRVAEELRKHADLAIKEGGMYYSGEYLDAIARRAESEQAENAKLREEYDMYRDLVRCMVHPDIPDQLAAENTKLRELVQELYEDQCDECDRWKYRDRMRELGMEVENGD
jgi:hypothetical protein